MELQGLKKEGKKIYIIGIAGVIGSSLARELQQQGWTVTGSDQKKVYPPTSTFLKKNKIKYFKGYHPKHIKKDLDLVIIAGSALTVDKNNPEYLKAKKLNLKIISQAQAVEKFIIRKQSIVVAGTYGKTTTTVLLTSILNQANFKPSYMFGGIPSDNHIPPLKITKSLWSVVEGDEYPTLFFDKRPKFWLYHPRYLILTGARWEHPDVYKTETRYLNVFKKLIDLIPPKGIIVASFRGENLKKILKTRKKVFWYSINNPSNADFWVENLKLNSNGIQFEIVTKEKRIPIISSLLGNHNVENILAAGAMADALGISSKAIIQGVRNAPKIKKRLEITYNHPVTIIEDFSQTKPRIISALQAIRDHFQGRRIILVFYPHYSGWQEKEILKDIPKTFDLADLTIITKVIFRGHIPTKDRVTGSKIVSLARKTNPNVFYQPKDEKVVEFLKNNLQKGDIIIFMSSGDYRGINQKLIRYCKKESKWQNL